MLEEIDSLQDTDLLKGHRRGRHSLFRLLLLRLGARLLPWLHALPQSLHAIRNPHSSLAQALQDVAC